MIAAGSILGELSEKRLRLPSLQQADHQGGDENILERGRGDERQLQAGQEAREARGEERLQRGLLGRIDGSDRHTWDQSNRAFYHQDVWSDALCRMQTSLALHL